MAEAKEVNRTISSGHKSQSENDWAYAKRALARGDDPELVIQRIADYRAPEKAQPEYYARRTVTKALADLAKTKLTREATLNGNSERKVSGSPEPNH